MTLCRIVETYFEYMDAHPDADKFQALQDVHKGQINGYSHAITFNGNGKNVSHKTLMKRFKEDKTDFFSGGLSINQAWNGGQ